MKKVFVLILFSLFIVAANVAAFDFSCRWEGYISCSKDSVDDPPVYFKGEIKKKGTFFTTLNITPTPGKKCSGVIDGKKISMTCENGTFVYGEIKGKTINIIDYIRSDNSTCKGSASLIR
ncbi:MAG: hypothetical protein LJE66_03370 [Desulfobacterales bacterium]|jgi:hypothetical protein|nr:hypothetical protein [Desulfobacterales bacterium]